MDSKNIEQNRQAQKTSEIKKNIEAADPQQIRRTKPLAEITGALNPGSEEKKKKDTKPDVNKLKSKKLPDEELKKITNRIPVMHPKTSSKPKEIPDKPLTAKELRQQEIAGEVEIIKQMHKNLVEQEKKSLTDEQFSEVKRYYYDTRTAEEIAGSKAKIEAGEEYALARKKLSQSDLEKRAEEAIKRKARGQRIMEYEATHPVNEEKYEHLDKEGLALKIKEFKKMRSIPYDMDNDEKFVSNMARNYELCDKAEHMKKWLSEAVDGGYMPKGEDMAALQEKIATFTEVKEYLDAQKELMKNPYYRYFAKEDMTYTDFEIGQLLDGADDMQLKGYLTAVSTIRSLHFVRRKGMKSANSYAEERGKRAARIMATREEKRLLLDKISDNVLNLSGNRRFLDRDYDSRFTPELFNETLARFGELKIEDLHFGSLNDIVEHFEENQYIFEQVHDMEHLLFVAVQRGLAPADNELLKLHAKIEAFTMAESMASQVQNAAIVNADKFIYDKTYEELEDGIYIDAKKETDGQLRHEPPRIGCDLKKYLKSVTKHFQKEDKKKARMIRMMYGITHPAVVPETGETTFGEISEEELEKRKAAYRKNSYTSDYFRNSEFYIETIYGKHLVTIAAAHAKRTGRPAFTQFGRVLTPYLTGKSAEEIVRVIDILQTGTDKEKEELWRSIADEANNISMSELDVHKSKDFFRNVLYRQRMEKMLGNLDRNAAELSVIKDRALVNKYGAFHNAACSSLYCSSYAQASKFSWMAAVDFDEWAKIDTVKMTELAEAIDSGDDISEFSVGDEEYSVTKAFTSLLSKSVERIEFMKISHNSAIHPERAGKGILDTAQIMLYDELKKAGTVKAVSTEDLKELSEYYETFERGHKTSRDSLRDDIVNEIRKTDPDYQHSGAVRIDFISNMDLLNTYDNEVEKCTSLYRSLIVNGKKTDRESKQEKALAIEEIFRTVLAFDLKRFDFKSYMDLINNTKNDPKRFQDCYAVTHLAVEAVNYMDAYKALRMDEEVRCRLSQVHLDEIHARIDLLMNAALFFDDNFRTLISLGDTMEKAGIDLGDVLHLTTEELDAKIADSTKKGDADLTTLWSTALMVRESLGGVDINVPLNLLENKVRHDRGLNGVSRAAEALNILNGNVRVLKEAGTEEINFTVNTIEAFRGGFAQSFKDKDYTVSERESKLGNRDSRLYKKLKTSETLTQGSHMTRDRIALYRRTVSLENRIAVGEKTLEYLSAFMDYNEDQPYEGFVDVYKNQLVSDYADEKKRFETLDVLTVKIMEYTDERFDVSSDEDFASRADDMEMISLKAIAYEKLLKANPEYEDRLRTRKPGAKYSDLELVHQKLDQMLAISDYYRARKALITDTYYILHYNDEISANRDKSADTDDKKRIADLISLVAQCTRRLAGGEYRSREDSGIERILDRVEAQGRQNAFLTGRPDLKRAKPSAVHNANKEIEIYAREADVGEETTAEEMAGLNMEKPYPKAQKYYTESVKNYVQSVITYNRIKNATGLDKVLTRKQKELYDRLKQLLRDKSGKPIYHPTLNDTVENEKWVFSIDISRMVFEACTIYHEGVSDDELVEIFEGLTLTERTGIDLNQKDQRLYARERFLDSAAKLFRLQRDALKRYQNTYGTLPENLPYGVFMESLGSGQTDHIIRSYFGQDLAQISDERAERKSESGGEKLTLAEILVKYNKITREEKDEAVLMNSNYYQGYMSAGTKRISSFTNYSPDANEWSTDLFTANVLNDMTYTSAGHKIKGPSISRADAKNIWQQTVKYGTDGNLTGGKFMLNYYKPKLDLYTSREKSAIRAQRQKDAGLVAFYSFSLEEQKESLVQSVKPLIGPGISDELLGKLIVFHPDMLKHAKKANDPMAEKKADADKVNAFIENVKKYSGAGIAEDHKAEARKEASKVFLDQWLGLFKGGISSDIEKMMNGDRPGRQNEQARANGNEIVDGSYLMIAEVRHQCFDTIKYLNNTPGMGLVLNDADRVKLESHVRSQLHQEILRSLINNSFYKELKDIGSMNRSYPERMHLELSRIMYKLGNQDEGYDLNWILNNREVREVLDHYGIKTSELDVFLNAAAEKKEEKKTEEKKAEKKSGVAEKTGEKQAAKQEEKKTAAAVKNDEKKEEKKTEKKDAKQEEKRADATVKKEDKKETKATKEKKTNKKKEENLNRINIEEEIIALQEQKPLIELPPIAYKTNVKAPVPSGFKYDFQGEYVSYCWASTMAGLMNSFAGKRITSKTDIVTDRLPMPPLEEFGEEKMAEYFDAEDYINEIYNGNHYGNPVIFADYIHKLLPNAAVRSAIIGRDDKRNQYCKRRFLETLSKRLEKGPVGMTVDGHFVLVRELRGDTIMINDSLNKKASKVVPYDKTVSQLFKERDPFEAPGSKLYEDGGRNIELVWLEDMTGQEEKIADEFNLNFNEETGEFTIKPEAGIDAADMIQVNSKETILHVNGLEATSQTGDDVVLNTVYVPKKIKVRSSSKKKKSQPEVKKTEVRQSEVKKSEIKKSEVKQPTVTNKQMLDTMYREPNAQNEIIENSINENRIIENSINENRIIENSINENKIIVEEKAAKEKWDLDLDDENLDIEYTDDVHDLEFEAEYLDMFDFEQKNKPKGETVNMAEAYFQGIEDRLVDENRINEIKEDEEIDIELRNDKAEFEYERDYSWNHVAGISVSQEFRETSAVEKAMKGKFTQRFLKSSGEFIKSIEEFLQIPPEQASLYKELEIEDIYDFVSVGDMSLKEYVRSNYKYDGNDAEILNYYIALISVTTREPVLLFTVEENKSAGRLEYKPKNLDLEIRKGNLKNRDKQYRVAGVKRVHNYRLDGAPGYITEKGGRAYRKSRHITDTRLEGAESLADRISTTKADKNQLYDLAVGSFKNYYDSIERYYDKKIYMHTFVEILHTLDETINLLDVMMEDKKAMEKLEKENPYGDIPSVYKKPKNEAQQLALDAIKELSEHRKLLQYALYDKKGMLYNPKYKDEIAAEYAQIPVSFREIFGQKIDPKWKLHKRTEG